VRRQCERGSVRSGADVYSGQADYVKQQLYPVPLFSCFKTVFVSIQVGLIATQLAGLSFSKLHVGQ